MTTSENDEFTVWDDFMKTILVSFSKVIEIVIFQDVYEPAAVVIKAIWNDPVHTLKGEWSSIYV